MIANKICEFITIHQTEMKTVHPEVHVLDDIESCTTDIETRVIASLKDCSNQIQQTGLSNVPVV